MARRLFIAIDLPEATKHYLAKKSAHLKALFPEIKWEPSGKYHITLSFLGSTRVSPEEIKEVLQRKLQDLSRFFCTIGELGVFEGKTVNLILEVVSSEELLKLFFSLQNSLENLGFSYDGRVFHPHILLGRSKSLIKTPKLVINYPFLVTQATVFESRFAYGGSVYSPLVHIDLLKTALPEVL